MNLIINEDANWNPETDYIAEGILEVMPDGYGF